MLCRSLAVPASRRPWDLVKISVFHGVNPLLSEGTGAFPSQPITNPLMQCMQAGDIETMEAQLDQANLGATASPAIANPSPAAAGTSLDLLLQLASVMWWLLLRTSLSTCTSAVGSQLT